MRTKKQVHSLSGIINSGDCVKIPDGRVARVRDISKNEYRVRVRRKNKTAEYLRIVTKHRDQAGKYTRITYTWPVYYFRLFITGSIC